jgi:hypothetical protein
MEAAPTLNERLLILCPLQKETAATVPGKWKHPEGNQHNCLGLDSAKCRIFICLNINSNE